MGYERPLRILTLVNATIALPLLIATNVVLVNILYKSYWLPRQVPAVTLAYPSLILTAITSGASLYQNRKHGQMPGGRFALLDLFTSVYYLSILIPIFVLDIGDLRSPGYGLLAGYLTAPMVMNM